MTVPHWPAAIQYDPSNPPADFRFSVPEFNESMKQQINGTSDSYEQHYNWGNHNIFYYDSSALYP